MEAHELEASLKRLGISEEELKQVREIQQQNAKTAPDGVAVWQENWRAFELLLEGGAQTFDRIQSPDGKIFYTGFNWQSIYGLVDRIPADERYPTPEPRELHAQLRTIARAVCEELNPD